MSTMTGVEKFLEGGLLEMISKVAEKDTSKEQLEQDGEYSTAYDIADGHADDTYHAGIRDGEIEFARTILAKIHDI